MSRILAKKPLFRGKEISVLEYEIEVEKNIIK